MTKKEGEIKALLKCTHYIRSIRYRYAYITKLQIEKKKQNTWIIELAYQQIFGASIVLFDCVRYRRRIIHDRVFMALFKILH